MAKIEQNYNLVIAVDPGFSDTKVVINGVMFKIPRALVDVTGKTGNFIIGAKQPGYILSHYIEGRDILLGEQAKALITVPEYKEQRRNMEVILNSYERFSTDDSEVTIMTAIGLALINYAEYSKKKNIHPEIDINKPLTGTPFKIYVGVALPNDAVEDKWGSVKKYLTGHHVFSIETEDGEYDLDFTIEKKNLMSNSQVISAFIGCIADDDGKISEDVLKDVYRKKLPALIIDGGYRTIADFLFTENYMAEGASSNTKYAMAVIYERAAAYIRETYGRNDVNADDIIQHLDTDGTIVCEKDGNTESVDIKPIVEKFKDEICQEYVEHLNRKYNKLLDVKQIIVVGGTGAAYYSFLVKYINEHKKHLKDAVTLTDYMFIGRNITPEFAIVVGMYKSILAAIRNAEEQV